MDTLLVSAHGRNLPNRIDPSILARFTAGINIITFSRVGESALAGNLAPVLQGIKKGGNGFLKSLISYLSMPGEITQGVSLFPFTQSRDYSLEEIDIERETYSSPYGKMIKELIDTIGKDNILLYDKYSPPTDIELFIDQEEHYIRIPEDEARFYGISKSFLTSVAPRIWTLEEQISFDVWKDDHPEYRIPTIYDDRIYLKDGFYQYPGYSGFPTEWSYPYEGDVSYEMEGTRSNPIYYMTGLSKFYSEDFRTSYSLKELIEDIPHDMEDKPIVIFIMACRSLPSNPTYQVVYDSPTDTNLLDMLSSISISNGSSYRRTYGMKRKSRRRR